MFAKHIVVVGVVVLGVAVDRLVKRVGAATTDEARGSAMRRLELSAEGATGFGALTILLTAFAQVAA